MTKPATLLGLCLALALGGCSGGPRVPYLGRWTGKFAVTSVAPNVTIKEPKRNELSGFLQLYRTEDRFALHLEGEQETLDVTGAWDLDRNRVVLHPKSVKIDDQGGEDLRDPNKAWIPAAALQSAYSIAIPLRISPDKRHLEGLTTLIGPLTGEHSFDKDVNGTG